MTQIPLAALLCAMLSIAATSAHAATFTVTNTNDSGAGSLRQAIVDAVAAPTPAHDHVIAFDIPGPGVHTIRPVSPLPPIKDLLIDGYTQPGSRANTLAQGSDAILTIELDGINAGAGAVGLENRGAAPGTGVPNVTVRGLVINRFGGAGILVTGPGGAGFPGFITLQGCYIGTDPTGTQPRGNGIGIDLGTDAQAVIGEPAPAFGGNTVPWPAYRNLISGNVGAGVRFDSTDPLSPAFGTVRGAYIGTDAAGTAALGNGGDGIAIGVEGAVGSAGFGSFVYLHDNLIAANAGDGIDTQGIGTQAVGNTIGSGSDGRALGNQGNGAYFHGSAAGTLTAMFTPPGAVGPGVSSNAGAGVLVADTAIVDVSGRFLGNVGLGVDLAPAGPAANDAGDADSGPNDGLNFPIITSAVTDGVSPTTRVQGTLHSKPNAQIQVLLYLNATCHPSGSGEAGRFLSTVAGATTDSSGNATFDSQLAFPVDTTAFPFVVAQSRRFAERTVPLPSLLEVSEFSACFAFNGGTPPPPPPPPPPPTPSLSIGDASVAEGNAGTTSLSFTVTLSAAATSVVTTNYASADGTATAGSDYSAAAGTLTFAVGESTKTVTVTINGDTTVEADETLTVTLGAPSGATLADAAGAGTLENDDSIVPPALPALSIGNVSVQEGGEARSVDATFTITLSAASATPVTVTVSTLNAAGNNEGSARDNGDRDYVRQTAVLTFTPGVTSLPFVVTVLNDRVTERPRIEEFTVFLRDATGATIARARGQGNIVDDDGPPPGSGSGGGGSFDAGLLAILASCVLLPHFRARRRAAARQSTSPPGRALVGPL